MGIKAAGAYLRQLREGTERSRAWVTRYVDADERQIGRIEAGEIDSRASLVFALAQLLGADLPTLQTMMRAPDDEATLASLDAVVPQQPSTERHSTLAPARHDQPDRSGEHRVSSRSARAPKQFTYQAGQFVPTSFSWPVDAADEEDADAVQWRTVLRAAGFDPAPLMTFGETPHGLKTRGFLGQPACWRAYPPTDVSRPV